ncbi:MAG: GTPase [Candidatus Tectomicrobia bacterium]|nr:GTPase [Candidatus Tectomicrobia bacterium]
MNRHTEAKRVLIMGAAGRDFHTFNTLFRGDPASNVVAFTAAQIPNITGRTYPASLAGPGYPAGIPIFDESELERLIERLQVELVVFAYSDVPADYVMQRAGRVVAAGADFALLGARHALRSAVPVVAVCAVRTGCGKSAVTRRVAALLREAGKRVIVVRHPMPYGDLEAERVQRFASLADLDTQHCTIEEREEYEPHLAEGTIVYAGVDYGAILAQAEQECDVLIWDGGNNDLPFYEPRLHITLVDPHRPGHELTYYPGFANLLRAHVLLVPKQDSARPEQVRQVKQSIETWNPRAMVIDAISPVVVEEGERLRGKRVLVVEDGPTVTHGGMAFGAGVLAAERGGAAERVDPRPWATGSIVETLRRYPHLQGVLPAMGYGERQIAELRETINRTPCDLVVAGTPIDLGRLLRIDKPIIRARYGVQEVGAPTLRDALKPLL